MVAVERQPITPERPMRIGKDFVLVRRLVVPPGARVPAEVFSDPFIIPSDHSDLHVSTSSKHIHQGLEIVSTGEEMLAGLTMDGQAKTVLRFKNHGKRVVVVDERKPVGMSYIEGENIEGKSLQDLLDKRVQIDGGHWEELVDRQGRPLGVRFYLNPQSPKEITPGRPIFLNGQTNYREILDSFASTPEPSATEIFWYAETQVRVKIAKGIAGVLQDPSLPRVRMLNSRLIHGGRTDWPIRAEYVSPTIPREMPTYVDMVFQKVA